VSEVAPTKRSHDLAAEDGHRLGVIFWCESIHGHFSLCRSIRRVTRDARVGSAAGAITSGGLAGDGDLIGAAVGPLP
jgi:hypothetical protein